jgi:hypothetical protein
MNRRWVVDKKPLNKKWLEYLSRKETVMVFCSNGLESCFAHGEILLG